MAFNVTQTLKILVWDKIVQWLTYEDENDQMPLSDFDRACYEIKPGDVILIEGRSRVSEIIKNITLSNWTHSVLYIGRLHNIKDEILREHVERFYKGDLDDQLIIEAQLGSGTIVENITKYEGEHLRICRPRQLARQDAQQVIAYAINQLGTDYDMKQIFDLARFMFPYAILPKRWRSSLFEHNYGSAARTVCSSMMAEAFASVHFPILPVLNHDKDGNLRLYRRNTKLITPKDFDYSPYFDVIKYPILAFDELAVYRKLPWDKNGVRCNDLDDCYLPPDVREPSIRESLEHAVNSNAKSSISRVENETDKKDDDDPAQQSTG